MKTADLIIRNAGELVTAGGAANGPKRGPRLSDLGIIRNGAVAVRDGHIVAIGRTDEVLSDYQCQNTIDAAGKVVMPGFVDPHTHLVFAGSRHAEYERKITGETYADTHNKGGGIHYTVRCTRDASAAELTAKALKALDVSLLHGTTTIEIKSGYGLDRENELKMLKVIRTLKDRHPVSIVSTYLGAHTVPDEYRQKRSDYIDLVKSLLPEIKERGLAEFCDVFCDTLGFSNGESRDILESAAALGFKLKLHAEQTGYTGGATLAAELGAVSADHLDYIGDPRKERGGSKLTTEHIDKLARSRTVGVLLPGVTFHLMEMVPGATAHKSFLPQTVAQLIRSDAAVALASDYNPGSSPTLSMQTVMQLSARLYRMNYAQSINASTINAAYAVDRDGEVGSLEPGKCADIVVFDCEEHGMLIDSFGTNMVDQVIKGGKLVVDGGRLVYGLPHQRSAPST